MVKTLKGRIGRNMVRMAVCSVALMASHAAFATDGVWNNNSSTGNWSLNTNWLGNNIADGAGSTADFSQYNITVNHTVTIDTTSRTVGTLLIGDVTLTDRSYIIAASGGAVLTFNNNGSTAQLTQSATSNGDTISAPIVLADNLNISSNSAAGKTFTISGGITGAKNLAINANTSGGITLSTTTINNGGTITNSGSGDGAVTISAIIGPNVTGVVQDSPTSQLTLSGVNTFTSGLTIKSGTLIGGNANALGGTTGTGAVTLGGGSGSANATLAGGSQTYANPITVAAGGTGTYTISNTSAGSAATFSGGITLNNNVTISETNNSTTGFSSGQYLSISGAISGGGNLTLAGNGGITLNNSGQPSAINNIVLSNTVGTTGSITNSGTGSAIVAISGTIANASSLNQNSATSVLYLTAANNTYSGATNVNSGVLRVGAAGSLSPNSTVTVASGATLQMVGTNGATTQTLNLSGNGTSFSTGALESVNTAAYVGNVVLAADSTVSDDLATTTLTIGTVGSTTITGSGKNLTVTGNGNTTLAGSLNTGAGSLTKLGTGTLTISGASSFTGLTSLNRGTLSLNISTALNGGGNITFGGGTLQYTANNNVDYASRIINSTGPIAIDTNNQARTLSSGLAASNTSGLTKIGSGTLTLSGTNLYTGITAVNGGQLAISTTSSLPSGSTVFTDVTGALNQGGAYTGVQGWLNSGNVATGSVGAIALTAASSENIDFTGFNNLMLGASTAVTYTGTITPGSAGYRLGGGAGTITLSNTNALTGGNTLVVGARSGNGSAGGGLILSAANNMTGTTTIASSTLTLNSATAGLTGSDVTVNRGASLAINYASGNLAADNTATRAKSVQLNGSSLALSGNIGGNTTETITNALTFASGQSTVNISPAVGKHELLSAGSFARTTGSTALITGTSLGVNANSATNVSSANVAFSTAPTLNGTGTAGGSGTTIGILTGVYGDTTTAGTGFGATGGLVTYDATNGVRLLNTGTEYISAIASGQTQLDNVRYVNATTSLVTTTLNAPTSINSLSLANTGTGGVTIAGAGSLQINSGVIHAYQGAADAVLISNTGGLDFNGQEAIILNQQATNATLTISNVISNATGLTKSGTGMVILSGTASNTYTGTTTVNAGNLRLSKTAGLDAVPGDLVINTSATVSMGASNQIADSSNVTINGGTLILAASGSSNGGVNETIHDLSMVNAGSVSYGQSYGNPTFTVLGNASVSSGATLFQNAGGQLNITGLTSLSDGGTLTVKRSQSPLGLYDGFVTLTGGLAITNTASGAYTPITINPGINIAQNGGKLILGGDVTFTGNSTNLNTTTIDGITGNGSRGIIALNGTRTFTIDDGAAVNDLTVVPAMVDGSSAGGLLKLGNGTLVLSGASTYTGGTTVSAGKLVVNGSLTSGVSINGTGSLGGSGTIAGAVAFTGGILSPGNSPGQLTVSSLLLDSGTTTHMEIGGTVLGTGYDNVNVTTSGGLTYGGAMEVVSYGGYNLDQVGTYNLFTFTGSPTGSFSGVTVGSTSLANSGGVWTGVNGTYTYQFTQSSGILTVTIPEPATATLLFGVASLGLLARRSRKERRSR